MRGLKASSAARRLSAVRQFHRFLFLEGKRPDDPTSQVDGPKLPRPLPKLLDEHELFGHDRFLLQMIGGGMAHAQLMRSIELFGTKVAPEGRRGLAVSVG